MELPHFSGRWLSVQSTVQCTVHTVWSFNDGAAGDPSETCREPAKVGLWQVFGKNTKSAVFPGLNHQGILLKTV